MDNHVKNYLDARGLTPQDRIVCENCRECLAMEIHHIIFRSQGGSDDFKNLICLCPECHRRAHGLIEPKLSPAELFLKKALPLKSI